MADAIPVHSEPKKQPNVKPIKASPELVETPAGTVVEHGNYAAKLRDGLGVPGDFAQDDANDLGTPLLNPRGEIIGYRKDH
jgi:hypothetical protein